MENASTREFSFAKTTWANGTIYQVVTTDKLVVPVTAVIIPKLPPAQHYTYYSQFSYGKIFNSYGQSLIDKNKNQRVLLWNTSSPTIGCAFGQVFKNHNGHISKLSASLSLERQFAKNAVKYVLHLSFPILLFFWNFRSLPQKRTIIVRIRSLF